MINEGLDKFYSQYQNMQVLDEDEQNLKEEYVNQKKINKAIQM